MSKFFHSLFSTPESCAGSSFIHHKLMKTLLTSCRAESAKKIQTCAGMGALCACVRTPDLQYSTALLSEESIKSGPTCRTHHYASDRHTNSTEHKRNQFVHFLFSLSHLATAELITIQQILCIRFTTPQSRTIHFSSETVTGK